MQYHKAAKLSELAEGKGKRVVINGIPIALFLVSGKIYAIADTCTHEHASLSEGEVQNCVVTCPRHGAQFELETGRAITLPAYIDAKRFNVSAEGDIIYVGE